MVRLLGLVRLEFLQPVLSSEKPSPPRSPIALSSGVKFIMRFRIYVRVKVAGLVWRPCLYACPAESPEVPALIAAVDVLKGLKVPIWSDTK